MWATTRDLLNTGSCQKPKAISQKQKLFLSDGTTGTAGGTRTAFILVFLFLDGFLHLVNFFLFLILDEVLVDEMKDSNEEEENKDERRPRTARRPRKPVAKN